MNQPIGRHPKERKKMAVTYKNSKNATTHYEVLQRFGKFTHIRCTLETGRTHQIRAHLAYIGHPLLNDGKYGTEEGRYRQALYSYKLVFNMKDAGILSYLDGRKFEIENCEIIQYFKENRYI